MEHRIKEIRVEGLFGMFDHTIPLNMDSRLTIIYGENGIGKTMIFRIVNAILSGDLDSVIKLPFLNAKISFLSGDFIFVEQDQVSYCMGNRKGRFSLEEKKTYKPGVVKTSNQIMFESIIPKKTRIKSLEPLLIPVHFKQLLKKTPTYFIQTQRLLLTPKNPDTSTFEGIWVDYLEDSPPRRIDAVTEYANEISELIQSKHSEYRKRSEELELSISKRLRTKKVKTDFTNEELLQLKHEVDKRRTELKAVGLLDDYEEEDFIIDDNLDNISRAIIAVSIQDIREKLKIFNDIYENFSLFMEILNEKRFTHKKISISEEKGFIFTNSIGNPLTVENLSSGEQHELVLLYQLLFKVSENSLILLDEPEISLHVSWQKEFLKDMKAIIDIRNFDLVIAPHSPAIINGNWDLTVSLKGLIKHKHSTH